jgi:molybdenum cofactor biosynthesis enzyme MoaA
MILYEDVFRAFQKAKVKYVIVGGIAVNLHGFLRSTVDMDILVEMTDENLKKVVTILKEKGYRVKQPVDPMGLADRRTRQDWIKNKNMKAFNFYKDAELKEVDIIIDSPVSYEAAKRNRVNFKTDVGFLPAISINDLLKMKKKAGRLADGIDIEQLKQIKKLRGRA